MPSQAQNVFMTNWNDFLDELIKYNINPDPEDNLKLLSSLKFPVSGPDKKLDGSCTGINNEDIKNSECLTENSNSIITQIN